MKKVKKSPASVSKLKKTLDAIFSRYIRLRDAGQCYTCPKKDHWKKMQCGHFVPRQYLALRYSEINCHCQCYACNMLYNGQPSKFAQNLLRDYGDNVLRVLEIERKSIVKDFPYQKLIGYYTQLVNNFIDKPV